MTDIHDIIEGTTKETGYNENDVEKVLRSMFEDVQHFASKKQGYCIQIPNLGTFTFRAGAIPNYADRQKSTLVYWINRLFIGEVRKMDKTVEAAKNNIIRSFNNLHRTAVIKQEYLERHAKYKPKTKEYLMADTSTDMDRMVEYIEEVKSQLFAKESPNISEGDLQ